MHTTPSHLTPISLLIDTQSLHHSSENDFSLLGGKPASSPILVQVANFSREISNKLGKSEFGKVISHPSYYLRSKNSLENYNRAMLVKMNNNILEFWALCQQEVAPNAVNGQENHLPPSELPKVLLFENYHSKKQRDSVNTQNFLDIAKDFKNKPDSLTILEGFQKTFGDALKDSFEGELVDGLVKISHLLGHSSHRISLHAGVYLAQTSFHSDSPYHQVDAQLERAHDLYANAKAYVDQYGCVSLNFKLPEAIEPTIEIIASTHLLLAAAHSKLNSNEEPIDRETALKHLKAAADFPNTSKNLQAHALMEMGALEKASKYFHRARQCWSHEIPVAGLYLEWASIEPNAPLKHQLYLKARLCAARGDVQPEVQVKTLLALITNRFENPYVCLREISSLASSLPDGIRNEVERAQRTFNRSTNMQMSSPDCIQLVKLVLSADKLQYVNREQHRSSLESLRDDLLQSTPTQRALASLSLMVLEKNKLHPKQAEIEINKLCQQHPDSPVVQSAADLVRAELAVDLKSKYTYLQQVKNNSLDPELVYGASLRLIQQFSEQLTADQPVLSAALAHSRNSSVIASGWQWKKQQESASERNPHFVDKAINKELLALWHDQQQPSQEIASLGELMKLTHQKMQKTDDAFPETIQSLQRERDMYLDLAIEKAEQVLAGKDANETALNQHENALSHELKQLSAQPQGPERTELMAQLKLQMAELELDRGKALIQEGQAIILLSKTLINWLELVKTSAMPLRPRVVSALLKVLTELSFGKDTLNEHPRKLQEALRPFNQDSYTAQARFAKFTDIGIPEDSHLLNSFTGRVNRAQQHRLTVTEQTDELKQISNRYAVLQPLLALRLAQSGQWLKPLGNNQIPFFDDKPSPQAKIAFYEAAYKLFNKKFVETPNGDAATQALQTEFEVYYQQAQLEAIACWAQHPELPKPNVFDKKITESNGNNPVSTENPLQALAYVLNVIKTNPARRLESRQCQQALRAHLDRMGNAKLGPNDIKALVSAFNLSDNYEGKQYRTAKAMSHVIHQQVHRQQAQLSRQNLSQHNLNTGI